MYFVSGCDNDITQSRSSLWGLKKMKMIKQVLKNIKGTTRKWREKKIEKKMCRSVGIDPVMSDRQADELTITPHDPMYT